MYMCVYVCIGGGAPLAPGDAGQDEALPGSREAEVGVACQHNTLFGDMYDMICIDTAYKSLRKDLLYKSFAIYIYTHRHIHIYIYIYIHTRFSLPWTAWPHPAWLADCTLLRQLGLWHHLTPQATCSLQRKACVRRKSNRKTPKANHRRIFG